MRPPAAGSAGVRGQVQRRVATAQRTLYCTFRISHGASWSGSLRRALAVPVHDTSGLVPRVRVARSQDKDGVSVGCGPTVQAESDEVAATKSAMGRPAKCRAWAGAVHVLGSQRCVTMGPLLMRRSLFAHVGGFDERLFRRGRPASLLDCDLSARVWSAGLAVVLA